jgi:hypothetical protein
MVKVSTKTTVWRHRSSARNIFMMAAGAVAAAMPGVVRSQGIPISNPMGAGTEMEQYLRVLGLVGQAPTGQWTVRAFGPTETASMTPPADHPWRTRLPARSALGRSYSVVAPSLALIGNSSFPYGFNDGPVWAGRGLTLVASGGASLTRGPFSIVANPLALISQNAEFRLAENGLAGDRRFADWSFPTNIDLPQRFGSSSYARLEPGESEARVELHGLAAGLSSRAELWGPAYDHPMILGNNAGGIPRLFAGTRTPFDLRWVTIHGRVLWGRLDESAYGPDRRSGMSPRHFATGMVGTIGVKHMPGFEMGGSRFFHTSWPEKGLRDAPWLRVIQAFISRSSSVSFNPDNQLASAFFRLAPPGRGFEVYGEYGREDRNASLRDALLEPDHIAAYMLGFARAWSTPDANRITVIRGEVLNSGISHLQQAREQAPWYVHGGQRNGHTNRGQVLGSAGAFGGGASVAAVDRYTPGGRTTVRWDRIANATPLTSQGLPIAGNADVTHAITYERSVFTRRGEFTASGSFAKEFNRHFEDDAFNATIAVGYRVVR